MANARERFVDVACEITGMSSPSEIRQVELSSLIAKQAMDALREKQDAFFMSIFEDPESHNGERE